MGVGSMRNSPTNLLCCKGLELVKRGYRRRRRRRGRFDRDGIRGDEASANAGLVRKDM